MCKNFFEKAMLVSRKTCKMKSCKSKIEGIMIGVVIGMAGGFALGMIANSEKGRKVRNELMCKCIDDCNEEQC